MPPRCKHCGRFMQSDGMEIYCPSCMEGLAEFLGHVVYGVLLTHLITHPEKFGIQDFLGGQSSEGRQSDAGL